MLIFLVCQFALILTDKVVMKTFFFSLFFMSISTSYASSGVVGEVTSVKDCSTKEVMVWLSLDKDNYQERLLLMHTLVPVGGKFQFYLKPGSYQLRASDEQGCSFYQKIKVLETLESIHVRMVKK